MTAGALCLAAAARPAAGGDRAAPPGTVSAERLEEHVRVLAGTIGERNLRRPEALEHAAGYIERVLRSHGFEPARQEYLVSGQTVCNIEVEQPGDRPAGEILVVGAHYDSAPGTPGADDNATGVAALLEIARLFSGRTLERTVRLVAFVNEEPPFFQTDAMGSRVYARRCRTRGERVVGMLCLETIGCYFDAEGTQRYPFPLGLFYPSRGDFIGFVGDLRSLSLVREGVRFFRRVVRFPAQGAALPRWVPAVGLSDHWSFWQEGYPAVMVTDTAPFRYPYYHTADDTPDKVDYVRLPRVVQGLAELVGKLAGARMAETTPAEQR